MMNNQEQDKSQNENVKNQVKDQEVQQVEVYENNGQSHWSTLLGGIVVDEYGNWNYSPIL